MTIPALEQLAASENTITKMLGIELLNTWSSFSNRIDNTPIINKILDGSVTLDEYKALLINIRAQVVDGTSWIARAASSFDPKSSLLAAYARQTLISHATAEQGDYRMLDDDYVSCGGNAQEIEHGAQNIGSFALTNFIFWEASKPNPFAVLGAIFIIEGMGSIKAGQIGNALKQALGLKENQVSFLMYHAKADEEHFATFARFLANPIISETMAKTIIKVAKTVALLYLTQLEQLGNT